MELPPPRANVGGKMDVRTGITLLPGAGSVAQMAVHYLGKIEVSGPNPLGASTIITMRYKDFYSVVE